MGSILEVIGVCVCSNIMLHITKSAMDPSEGDMNTMAAIILQIPYNDLDLTGANYTIVILRGNPCQCVAILRVPSSTFKFLCTELIQVKMEPVSKLLSMEEQLAIFLYITGHNNSNRLVQDRFQHSGQTISKVFRHILHLLVHLAGKFISSPPSNRVSGHITSNPKFSPFFNNCVGAIYGVHIPVPSNREELFNLRHSSLRNVIERTFGQQYDIVIACCVHVVCAQDTQEIYNDQ
ncbi:uncharacterized protein VP01_335g1 [Puccinia sorghi]|uniref:DUF8040 domain-containing protein n=1 Tax=Puccinia sorghi TaxID=27349 RepID=A0A0L6UXT0_9BASI|nr:uncharacterized protein VP01_335g1 [Puccinia sorghi]